MNRIRILALLAPFVFMGNAFGQGESIKWEANFQAALEKAKAENKPVFIAINMDGEQVCETLAKEHYRNPRLKKLSENMVNLFASRYYHKGGATVCERAGHISCASHQQVEKDLRKHLPEVQSGDEVIAPNHIFLDPDGKVILSVPYMITEGQLEWCMKEAIRKVNPSFSWTLGKGAKAPRRVIYNKVVSPSGLAASSTGPGPAQPLSKTELEALISQFKKIGRGTGIRELESQIPSLIVTEDKKALDLVKSLLGNRWIINRGLGTRLIHEIGRTSPPMFWKTVAPHVSHENKRVRNEAVVALEQMGVPKSLKTLLKQKTAEKDDKIKANLIRAIAAVGKGVRSAESLVLKTAEKDKKPFMRIHGVIGLVHVDNREKVAPILEKSLIHEEAGLRAAAAYTIAIRRETDMVERLKSALVDENSPDVRVYIRAALDVLQGGELTVVKGVLKEFALDTVERDRNP